MTKQTEKSSNVLVARIGTFAKHKVLYILLIGLATMLLLGVTALTAFSQGASLDLTVDDTLSESTEEIALAATDKNTSSYTSTSTLQSKGYYIPNSSWSGNTCTVRLGSDGGNYQLNGSDNWGGYGHQKDKSSWVAYIGKNQLKHENMYGDGDMGQASKGGTGGGGCKMLGYIYLASAPTGYYYSKIRMRAEYHRKADGTYGWYAIEYPTSSCYRTLGGSDYPGSRGYTGSGSYVATSNSSDTSSGYLNWVQWTGTCWGGCCVPIDFYMYDGSWAAGGYFRHITIEVTRTPITYYVKYNGNGNTGGSTGTSTHTYNTAKNLTSNGFTRSYKVTYNANGGSCGTGSNTANYGFAGWATSSSGGVSYSNGASVKNLTSSSGATVNLYAKWNSAAVTLPTPSRTGYVFNGWYTASSGGSKVGGAGGSYTPGGNITLYAQWSALTYYIQYNGNGATSGSMSNSTYRYDSWYNLTSNAFSRKYTVNFNSRGGSACSALTSTYSFAGWEDRGQIVWGGTTWTYTMFSMAHYANSYSDLLSAFGYHKVNQINHYVNNGKGEGRSPTGGSNYYPNQAKVANMTVANGYTVPLYAAWNSAAVTLPTPTLAGFTFQGWYTASNGGGTKVGAGGAKYTPTSNVTLYAYWTMNNITWSSYATSYSTEYKGSNKTLTATPSHASSPSYTYQWQQSTNGSTWGNVSGATSNSYTFSASQAKGTYYFRLYTKASKTVDGTTYTKELTGGTITVTITPVKVTLSWGTTSFTFDGGTKVPSCTVSNVKSGDTCTVTVTGGQVNAGSYTATASSLSNSNYTLSGVTATKAFTIDRKDLSASTVTMDAVSAQTYTGSAFTPTPAVKSTSAPSATLTKDTNYTLSYSNNVNAGTATVTATGKGNYKGTRSVNFTINKRPISDATMTLSGSWTYNGSAQTPTPTLSYNSKTPTYTLSYSNNTNAGTATVTATGTGNFSSTKSVNFTINAYSINGSAIGVTAPSAKTYNGSAQTSAPTVKFNSTTLTSGTHYTLAYSNNTNAGTASVTITGKGNFKDSRTTTFTISPKSLSDSTITMDAVTTAYTYDKTAKKPAPAVKSTGGPAAALVYGTDYTLSYSNNTNAGTATVTATGKGNYKGTRSVNFTIGKKEVTLSWSNTSFTYDRASHVPTCTVGGLISGDTCTATVTGARTDAVNGTATASSLSNANYKLPSANTKAFTISAKSIASDIAVTLSATSFVYDKTAKTPTPTAKWTAKDYTLVSGTDYTASYSSNINVTSVATVTLTGKGNYTGNKTANFSITQKPVTLTWTNTSFTYDGSSHNPTLTVSGVCTGDTCTVSVSSSSKVNAGTYTATAGTPSNGNYKLPSNSSCSFTILPYDFSSTYTMETPANVTYKASAYAPTPKVYLPTKPTEPLVAGTHFDYSYANNTNAGTATVTATGKGNYTGTISKTFTINKASLTVTANNASVTYGSSAPSFTATYAGFVGSQTSSVLSGTLAFTCTYTAGSNVGTYTITPKGLTSPNYTITFANGTLTVNKRTATLSWTNTSFTYDKASHKPTCTVSNKYGSDTVTVTVSGEKTAAGSYTATATALDNANYQLPSAVTQSFTINKKQVTLSWSNTSLVFNGASQTPKATVTNLCSGDSCSVTVTGGKTNVGTGYTATADSLGNGNYKLPTTKPTTTFEITPFDISGGMVKVANASLPFTNEEYTAEVTKVTKGTTDIPSTGYSVTSGNKGTNVGTYTVVVTGTGNYKGTASTSWNITKGTYNMSGVTFVDGEFEYDGTAHSITVTGTLPTGADGSKPTVTYTGNGVTNVTDAPVLVTAKFTAGSNNYYNPESMTAYITVLPRAVEILWNRTKLTDADVTTFTYTGAKQDIFAMYYDDIEGKYKFLETSCSTDFINAGSYVVTASMPAGITQFRVDPNNNTKTYTMNPKSIEGAVVTLGAQPGYNGTEQTQTVSSVVLGTTDITTYTVTGNKQTNVDNYTLTVTGTGNYCGSIQKNWTLTKGTYDMSGVSFEDTSYQYDGQAHSIKIKGTLPTGADNIQVQVSYSGEVTSVAQGKVLVTASFTSSSVNYYKPDDKTAYVWLDKVTVTIDWCQDNFVYNGSTQTIGASYKDVTGADVALAISTSEVFKDAGSYTATASFAETTSNYKLPKVVTKDYTMAKKSVSGALVSLGSNLTYTGTEQTKVVKSVTLAGVSGTITYDVTGNAQTNAGNYTLTITGNGNFEGTKDVSWSIAKATYDMSGVVMEDKEYTYDGTAHSITVSGTLPTGKDGIQVTVNYVGSATNVTDGAQTVTASFATTSTNYVGTIADKTATVRIVPKTIQIIWSQTEFVYDGTVKTISAYYKDILNNNVELATSVEGTLRDYSKDGYKATATMQYGETNYAFDKDKGGVDKNTTYITIGRMNLTNENIVVTLGGELTYSGTEQTKQIVSVKTTGGLDVTYTVVGDKGTDAGDYSVVITSNGNFKGSVVKGWSIARSDLTIKAKNKTIVYGDSPANDGVEITGFVGGETVADLEGSLVYSYNYKQYGTYGYYTITPSGYTSNNYNITYEGGQLAVEQKTVILAWGGTTFTYNGSLQTPTASVSGVLAGDTCVVSVTGGKLNAGSYTATAKLSNNNYKISGVETTSFVINPVQVTVLVAKDVTYDYNGKDQNFLFTTDVNTTYCTVSGNVRKNAGEYEVTVQLNNTTNYVWKDATTEEKKYTFVINKALVETPSIASKVYTGEKLKADFEEDVLFNVEDYDGYTDVGTYNITLSIKDTVNSKWTDSDSQDKVVSFGITKATNEWTQEAVVSDWTYSEEAQVTSPVAKFGSVNVEYSAEAVDAGDYSVTFSVAGTDNYTGLSVTKNFKINKKAIDVTNVKWDYTEAFDYNGQVRTLALINLPTEITSVNYTANEKTDAGKYTAKAVLNYNEKNYTCAEIDDCAWEIKPITIDVVWMKDGEVWTSTNSYSYTADTQVGPKAQYNDNGTMRDLKVTMYQIKNDGTKVVSELFQNAGRYEFVAEFATASINYKLNEATQSLIVLMNKRVVTKPVEDTTEYFCNGSVQTYKITSSGEYKVSNNTREKAGSQEVTVELWDAENNQWNDGTTNTLTFEFTIQHKAVHKIVSDKYFFAEADCTHGVTYFYSCDCGEYGTELFEAGEPLGHDYADEFKWEGGEATCILTCARCESVTEKACEVKTEIVKGEELSQQYYIASYTEEGKTYTDKTFVGFLKGGILYEGPVWKWTKTRYGFTVKAEFTNVHFSKDIMSYNADLAMTDGDENLLYTAKVKIAGKELSDTKEVKIPKLTLKYNDGKTADKVVSVLPDTKANSYLFVPEREGYIFYGWKTESGEILYYNTVRQQFVNYIMTLEDATFSALWQSVSTVEITAKAYDGELLKHVVVSLMENGEVFKYATTDNSGKVTFTQIPFGNYNIMARLEQGNRNATRTFGLEVNDLKVSQEIVFDNEAINTVIKGNRQVSSKNIDNALTQKERNDINAQLSDGTTQEFTLSLSAEEATDTEAIDSINTSALQQGSAWNNNLELVDYIDILFSKSYTNGEVTEETEIKETAECVTLTFPITSAMYEKLMERGGTPENNIFVYRSHTENNGNKSVEKMKKEKYADESGEYYAIKTIDGIPYIVVNAKKFSTYAFGVQDTVVQQTNAINNFVMDGWTYGESQVAPVAEASYGVISYQFSNTENGTYVNDMPTTAGTYYVKASVKEAEEYTAVTVIKSFDIAKATYDMTGIAFESKTFKADGNTYSLKIEGTLPEGVSVVYVGNGQNEAGEYTVTAKFISEDGNYNAIPDMTAKLTLTETKNNTWWIYVAAIAGALVLIGVLIILLKGGKKGGAMFGYRV